MALADGDSLALDIFVQQIAHEDGYVFQSRLQPHPQLQEVCGGSVSTIRVIIIIDDSGPEIIETVWKVPTTGSIADNFWRSGNMLAAVDTQSGEVTRAIRGFGPDLEELDDHPDTQKPLKGFVLPHWEGVKALCLDYAMAFHKLRYQSWDIAVCPDGPVVVEVNTGSAFNLSQLATGKGLLTDRVRAFLEDCGYLKKKRRG